MLLGVWSLVRVRARRGCLTLGIAVISVVCCAAQPGPDTVLALSDAVISVVCCAAQPDPLVVGTEVALY